MADARLFHKAPQAYTQTLRSKHIHKIQAHTQTLSVRNRVRVVSCMQKHMQILQICEKSFECNLCVGFVGCMYVCACM
jgi:hypothetical protein